MLGQRFLMDGREHIRLSDRQKEAKRRVMEEGKQPGGSYRLEAYPCECGATERDFDALAEKDRYGLPVRTVICRNCGLIMTNPRYTQQGYDHFYASDYGRLYRNQEKVEDAYFEERILTGKSIYDFVEKYGGEGVKKHKEVLEIGCAAGGILFYFKQKGCRVTGVDLDDKYIEYGKRRGLDLKNCHSSRLTEEGKKYDLIILNHVFEHFLHIEEELKVIRALLAEDGLLYIAVPGVKNLTNSYLQDFLLYLQNAHIYHFTLRTLEQVLYRYGFRLQIGNEMISALFRYTGSSGALCHNYFLENMKFLFDLEFNLHYK